MSKEPLISVILCVKNGMPYLPKALESLPAQTYKNFEVIVQDGGSDDGSLEILQAFKDAPLDIVSKIDAGVGQAYNRAAARCHGDIVGSLDADNLLEPDALMIAVETFDQYPEAAAIYGSVQMINANGTPAHKYEPAPFDLLQLLSCELVPPFSTSFYSSRVCGSELRFDESLKTCADLDLWTRIGHLPIVTVRQVLGRTRMSDKSMTRRPESYEQFCVDKIRILSRYLERMEVGTSRESLRDHAVAGVYLWAAESLHFMAEGADASQEFLEKARSVMPKSPRLRELETRWGRKTHTGLFRGWP